MATKKQKLTRSGIALAIGLSGCGVERAASKTAEPTTVQPTAEQPTTPSSRAELEHSVQESLARLRALDLFTVDRMVMTLPANAGQCYGLCPGEAEAYDVELARQAKRLSAFAEKAEACNSGNCYVFTPKSGAEALEALNALEIVHVTSLVTAEPKNNASCYNLPCPEDVATAKTENRRREVIAFTIANYARSR
ncbi:MAG: hypothetical protein Q8N26_11045 [Myxococcales bacterium]|nr:hypothetical protein [Myxococcales bacterium]